MRLNSMLPPDRYLIWCWFSDGRSVNQSNCESNVQYHPLSCFLQLHGKPGRPDRAARDPVRVRARSAASGSVQLSVQHGAWSGNAAGVWSSQDSATDSYPLSTGQTTHHHECMSPQQIKRPLYMHFSVFLYLWSFFRGFLHWWTDRTEIMKSY